MKRLTFLLIAIVASLTEIKAETVATKTVDNGGSGPYKAVVAKESTLPDYTIYRPKNLAAAVAKEGPLPLLVWGNGACSNSNLGNERMLNQIASKGYVVVAVGPYRVNDNDGFVDNGSDGPAMTKAVDWIVKQKTLTTSEYYGMIDTEKIAASGHSCGGAEAMYTSKDKRVSTIIMMNSGMGGMSMGGASPSNLSALHGPILYVVGGPDDVAYSNALSDYDAIKVNVPVCFMTKNIGHGGTFWDQYGGDYGKILPDWLDWVFKGKKENIKMFRDGVLTGYSGWTLKSKNMPSYADEDAAQLMKRMNYLLTSVKLTSAQTQNESIEWSLEETEEGYVHLSNDSLVIDRHPEGTEPLAVGILTARITYMGKTTVITNRIVLAPNDDTYGYLFAYVNDESGELNFALNDTKSRKLTFGSLLHDEAAIDMTSEGSPLNASSIVRTSDGKGALMVCSEAAGDSCYTLKLLSSDNMVSWKVSDVNFNKGRSSFSDSTRAGAYITDSQYRKITNIGQPQIVWDRFANDLAGGYLVYFTVTSNVTTDKYTKLYYSYANDDFTMITQPKKLLDAGAEIGSASITFNPYDSLYHMVYTVKTGEVVTTYGCSNKRIVGGTWGNKETLTLNVTKPSALCLRRNSATDGYYLYFHDDTQGVYKYSQLDYLCSHPASAVKVEGCDAFGQGTLVEVNKDNYDLLTSWSELKGNLLNNRRVAEYSSDEALAKAVDEAEHVLNSGGEASAEQIMQCADAVNSAREALAETAKTRLANMEPVDLTVLIPDNYFHEIAYGTFNDLNTLLKGPAGTYELTCSAFFRQGSVADAYKKHVAGTERGYARLYACSEYTEIMSVYDDSAYYTYEPYTYPNDRTSAKKAFAEGRYRQNSLTVTMADGGSVKVGVYKTVRVADDWTCYDDLRLRYLGPVSSVKSVEDETVVRASVKPAYNIAGQPVTYGYKGIIIRDGKKILQR